LKFTWTNTLTHDSTFLLFLAPLTQVPPSKKQEKNFLRTIRAIISSLLPEYESPEFTFAMNRQAAEKNWTVLQSYTGDLRAALDAPKQSQLGYGSEFRPHKILEPLFSSHVLWPNMKEILTNGASFPLEPLDEELRKQDLAEAITMGNHKGAMKQPQVLENLMGEDVFRGYSLPIPLEKVTEIDGVIMAPYHRRNGKKY
jgi:hypothetical protein